MKRGATAGALTALILAGCGSAPVREPPAPLPAFQPAFQVQEAWSVEVGAGTQDYLGLVPIARAGTVYAAGSAGRVSALTAESGKREWQTDLDLAVGGGVGVGADIVAVGTRRGQVIALARDSGKQVWTASVSSEVLAPPALGDAIVVVQTVDGRVFGLSAADGKRLWVYERSEPALSLRGTAAPVIAGDVIIAGFGSGKLVVLSLDGGRPLWETTVSQPRGRNEIERLVDVDAPPVLAEDAVYAANYQGKLVAVNPRGGNVIWSRDVSTYTGLAADATHLYVTDEHSHVLALDRSNGASLWKQEALRGRRLSPPAVHGDFVVVADYEGYVHWLARADGRFIARHRVGRHPVRAPAAVADGTLFVAATSGTLSALRLTRK